MQTKQVEYKDNNTTLKGFVAFDDTNKSKRPLVLIAHDWSGCNDFAKNKAEALAKLGYIGFAIDMFGDGEVFETVEEKSAAIKPFFNDRKLLIERITAAYHHAKTLDYVDTTKIAAIGFCFGGMCVLDLARSGADLKAVTTFHGILAPLPFKNQTIKAKVLALHGHDDPMVPPEMVLEFEKEMTEAKVDWQVHVYGNTQHAFANPAAHDVKLGTVYNKLAAERSWVAMESFFREVLS